jgi:hypothetical protein
MKTKSEKSDWEDFFKNITDHAKMINESKLFAGLMIIVLNISSKFVDFKISKPIESYLKNTFSRQVLVFAIAWMGTRDIFIAALFSFIFIFCVDYLFNENSVFCCLSENFTNYHLSLLQDDVNSNHFTKKDVDMAMHILEKAQRILEKTGKTIKPEIVEETINKPYLNQTPLV